MYRWIISFVTVGYLLDIASADHEKQIFCYVSGQTTIATEKWKYTTSFIPFLEPKYCTHLVYSNAVLDDEKYEIQPGNADLELDNDKKGIGYYSWLSSFKKFRYKNTKVLLSVGSWDDGPLKLSVIAQAKGSRKTFIDSAISLLTKYHFDGLDINWNQPTSINQVGYIDSFLALLTELKEAMKEKKLMLTVTVLPVIYKIKEISNTVDFINLKTFNYHGFWDTRTGFNAPLHSNEPGSNIKDSIKAVIDAGVSKDKIIMGIPFYGRIYNLKDANDTTVGSRIGGLPPNSEADGIISYNEVCNMIKKGRWTGVWDFDAEAPYAYRESTWISYENSRSIKAKAMYAKDADLAGVMIWKMDMDDHQGSCHGLSYSLMRAVEEIFPEVVFV